MLRTTALFACTLLALSLGPAHAGNPAAGKEKSQTCAACHGPQGNSPNTQYPRLAGQHASYLYHTLKTYKSGKRKNAVMNGMAAGLSDQDMRDLAAYFANQQGLYTLPLDRGAAPD